MTEEQKLQDDNQEIRDAVGDAVDIDADDPQDSRVADLQNQLEEARQKTLYAQAETQNVRRRLEGEKQAATAYAVTNFARDILSVADNLQRGLAAIPDDAREEPRFKGLLTGLEATGSPSRRKASPDCLASSAPQSTPLPACCRSRASLRTAGVRCRW